MTSVRIGPGVREQSGGWVRVRYPVEGLEPTELVFEVDGAFGSFVDDGLDAPVVSLLVPAMAAGMDVVAAGPMSARLVWSLHNTVIPAVGVQLGLRPVQVRAPMLRDDRARVASAVLTGLSCGVDSFTACLDHLLDESVAERDRITHFLYNHIGSHGYGGDLENRVARRWERVRDVAYELRRPVIRVRSNQPEFYPPEHDSPLNFMATLTLRNAAVPLLLQAGTRRFLLASSTSWGHAGVYPTDSMAYADAILLPALGTEKVDLEVVGTHLTRVEKTRRIAELDIVRRHLDVCVMEGEKNCSRCGKCLRTLLTLELLGRLDGFTGMFDLTTYRAHRGRYLAEVLASEGLEFEDEIRDLIAATGFRPPWRSRAGAWVLKIWRRLPGPLRRRLRSPVGRVAEKVLKS